MEREPVISSNISSVGYDPSSETLEIEFTNGSVYEYCGVPYEEYLELMDAGSIGEYFHQHIRNSYPYS